MLVKFDSKAGQFFMDGEIAVQLLKLMGNSGTVPGAILGADVGAAHQRLAAAVRGSSDPVPSQVEDSDAAELPVSLKQRAYPLLDLLERAARQGADVLWDRL
ncbi:MAG: DUF1840 domain-containing protein [Burkholderiales bacterium]|nr:DUF1840 domain-containing protein [Burkholderiales bacterium]